LNLYERKSSTSKLELPNIDLQASFWRNHLDLAGVNFYIPEYTSNDRSNPSLGYPFGNSNECAGNLFHHNRRILELYWISPGFGSLYQTEMVTIHITDRDSTLRDVLLGRPVILNKPVYNCQSLAFCFWVDYYCNSIDLLDPHIPQNQGFLIQIAENNC